jgi:hypothetical protein
LLSAVKAGEVSEAAASQRRSRTPPWVWVALDPVTKLLLALDVGGRTLAMAQRLVHQVVEVLAPQCMPLFLTDGLKEYRRALLTHYGHWVQPPRQRVQGPAPKPRWRVCEVAWCSPGIPTRVGMKILWKGFSLRLPSSVGPLKH